MPPFKITNKAREDLIGIARYTESTWGRDQRKFYLKPLDSSFMRWPRVRHLAESADEIRQHYYKYPEGSHVIYFRLGTDCAIETIRILHRRNAWT